MTLVAALVASTVWSGLGAGGALAATTVNSWGDLVTAVSNGGTVGVALGADITGPSATSLVLPGGEDLTLDLNGHSLTVMGAESQAGVQTTGARLTINATGGGSLKATGGDDGAGIGSSGDVLGDYAGGTVTVNAGTVTATGGYLGAGIGGGIFGAGGTVTVNGGTVTATGGYFSAGIGGGASGNGGTVTVNAGTVTATGGFAGAGIGGGTDGAGGSVVVGVGASVVATSGPGANAVVGSNGGQPYGTVTNSGSLTLNDNQTIYQGSNNTDGVFTNTGTGVLTVNTRVGGSGTLVNDGTVLLAPGAYIQPGETHVTVHNYQVSYSLNGQPGTAPPNQSVYAASFAAGQVTIPAPPTGTRWMSAPSGGVEVTATTDMPTVFGVNTNGTVNWGATNVTLYAQPIGDRTPPTVSITRPAEGATYRLGESVTAAYTCADEAGGSGLADCVGTVANGAPIDTASVGAKTFTVTAHDNAGNQTILTSHYGVTYAFSQFLAPIDNGALNVVKAGQSVPVKFSLGGDQGLGILAGSPTSQPVQCDGSLPSDSVEQTATAGASGLSYDPATSTYSYIWKTDKAWANTCRQLIVTFNDATSHSVLFKFTG